MTPNLWNWHKVSEAIELLSWGEGFLKIDGSYFVNEQRQKFYLKIFLTYVLGTIQQCYFWDQALGLQVSLDVWVETHAWSGFIWESFSDVTVGGFLQCIEYCELLSSQGQCGRELIYIHICIKSTLLIEYDISMSIYIYKWYILKCSCPPFQNYFAASECQFADPSKYYKGVRGKKHNVKGFCIPQGVRELGQ